MSQINETTSDGNYQLSPYIAESGNPLLNSCPIMMQATDSSTESSTSPTGKILKNNNTSDTKVSLDISVSGHDKLTQSNSVMYHGNGIPRIVDYRSWTSNIEQATTSTSDASQILEQHNTSSILKSKPVRSSSQPTLDYSIANYGDSMYTTLSVPSISLKPSEPSVMLGSSFLSGLLPNKTSIKEVQSSVNNNSKQEAALPSPPWKPLTNSGSVLPAKQLPDFNPSAASNFNFHQSSDYFKTQEEYEEPHRRKYGAEANCYSCVNFQDQASPSYNEANHPSVYSTRHDLGYHTEQSPEEEIYLPDDLYCHDNTSCGHYNYMDSSIRSINYCQTEESGEEMYDASVIVEQLEASLRQQVDLQVQSFHSNLHDVLSDQLLHFKELVMVQPGGVLPCDDPPEIHSIDGSSHVYSSGDDASSGYQQSTSSNIQPVLEEDQLCYLLIKLLTHSSRLSIALMREQYTL